MESEKSNAGHRTMLITGASGGLGRALVRHFADKNMQLVLHYHQSKVALEDLVNQLKWFMEPILVQADLRSEEAIVNMCGRAQKETGHVDILINNAGISGSGLTWKETLDNWNHIIQINLSAPFLVMKHLIPGMRYRNWGRIVNVTSIVAQIGVAGASAYAASKSGLFGLTASAAKELSTKGITVNSIALGYMDEGMIHTLNPTAIDELKQRIPLRTLGKPNQYAALVEYLISEEAAYMTGQTLNLNGGLYAH